MKKLLRPPLRSVKSKLLLLVVISYAAFTALLTYSSARNIALSWEKFLELNRNILALHSHNVDMVLSANDQYLASLSPTAYEFEQSSREQNGSQDTLSRIHFQQELKSGTWQGASIDGTFFFFPATQEFLTVSAAGTEYAQRAKAKAGLTAYIAEHEMGTDRWVLLDYDNEAFLCRILQMGSGYLGMWVSTDTLIELLGGSASTQIDYVAFLADDGRILDNREFFREPAEPDLENGRLSIQGSQYVLTQSRAERGEFSLVGLVDEQKVLRSFEQLYDSTLLFALLLLALMVTFILLLQKSILTPLRFLTDAMNTIRRGHFQIVLEPQSFDQEFQVVLETFNAMTSEIEKLKLSVYEEKILRMKTKQQYYQLQINPHFLTNSFNMIYQFAQVQNTDLIQKMAIYLSAYFRYTMKNEREWVSLEDELSHVKNYLKIQKIRYPYHLEVTVTSPPELAGVRIPPLTIQPFVENAVKYAVNMDNITTLQVCGEAVRLETGPGVLLRIADDGPGFPEEMLETLQRGERIVGGAQDPVSREHIGIYNVQQRLRLLYHGEAQVHFSSNSPHGAVVEITIPVSGTDETGSAGTGCGTEREQRGTC